ncbi:acylphosphatase [Thermodesulfobacteriota bacterium]
MTEQVRAHVIISGRVQGVFFRVETKRMADETGVFGWVRNLRDGTVEAVFEGDRQSVDAALSWCREGPPHAIVDRLDLSWQDYIGEFSDYKIRY